MIFQYPEEEPDKSFDTKIYYPGSISLTGKRLFCTTFRVLTSSKGNNIEKIGETFFRLFFRLNTDHGLYNEMESSGSSNLSPFRDGGFKDPQDSFTVSLTTVIIVNKGFQRSF